MNFDNLIVWQKSKDLTIQIIKNLEGSKRFGIIDQISRAAISIPSNIAEGYERETNKEVIRYLYIAKGSCGELRTQLIIANEIGLIDKETAEKFIKETKEISFMLNSLIKKRKTFK
jgi:four helix bundle protein